MPFTQTYHGSIQEVYNVDGTLLLNRSSGPPDLAQGLLRLKAELAALAGLAPEARQKIETSINEAFAEAKSAKPDGSTIKKNLDAAAETLKSASSLTDASKKLIETIISVGKWAILFLA